MVLLVGLGNPGIRYARTRHNAGFLVLDALAGPAGWKKSQAEAGARITRLNLEGREVLLAKPMTYMNASGTAVAALFQRYGVPLARLLVVADDIDLPLGVLRFRQSGGSGGHRGLESIINALNTKDFPRLRVGVGRPVGDAADHVLSPLYGEEREAFRASVARAAEAVLTWLREGPEAAMNRFNRTPDRI